MESTSSLQQIRLSKSNKDQILQSISQEENVNIKYNIKETLYEYINRPMTLANSYRRQLFLGFFRAAFAITLTVCSIYFNIYDDKLDRSTKTTLPILYFSITFVFILSNLSYYNKVTTIYKNFNLKRKSSLSVFEELMRSLSYLCLPIMISLIVFDYKNFIWLAYLTFLFLGYLSNISDELKKNSIFVFFRAALLVGLSLLFICIPNILTLKYLRDHEMIIKTTSSFIIILCSVFLTTQKKYLKNIITNKTRPSFLLKIVGSLFLTNILMFTLHDIHTNYTVYKWVSLSYNILVSVVCLFIPCIFGNLQLKVDDKNKIKTRCNLLNIFSIFKDMDVEFKSFQHYYINLRKKLSKMKLEKNQQNICSYLNNNGGNTPTSLINAIEDLVHFNRNSNITFNGYFNYSPGRMVIPPTKEYWVTTINEETELSLRIERFRNFTIMEYLMGIVKIEYILFDISLPINIYLNKEEIVNTPILAATGANTSEEDKLEIPKPNNVDIKENKEVSNDNKQSIIHIENGEVKEASSFIINSDSPEQKFFSHLLPEDSDSMLLEKYDADSNDFQLHAKYENKENIKPVIIPSVEDQNAASSYSNIIENFDLSSNNTTNPDSSIPFEPNVSITNELIIRDKVNDKVNTSSLKTSETSTMKNKESETEDRKKVQKRKRRVTIIDPSLTYVSRKNVERGADGNNIN